MRDLLLFCPYDFFTLTLKPTYIHNYLSVVKLIFYALVMLNYVPKWILSLILSFQKKFCFFLFQCKLVTTSGINLYFPKFIFILKQCLRGQELLFYSNKQKFKGWVKEINMMIDLNIHARSQKPEFIIHSFRVDEAAVMIISYFYPNE